MREQDEKVLKMDQIAHDWLHSKPENEWSRSHFEIMPKYDILLNNNCESFNYDILEGRQKHILSMLEWLRHYVMTKV